MFYSTILKEIRDYFSHNPKDSRVALVLLNQEQYNKLVEGEVIEDLDESSIIETVDKEILEPAGY
jgi:hypothetical protein|tara:strand:- start:306 stop:500 length:195 start_codon:yes stop_codon:yes gene_type:complete